MFDLGKNFPSNAVIKVIGVGGGGGNAINTMIESGLAGVEFIAANTDLQALQSNLAPIKIQLGRELTKGLGAGANPEVGRDAALEDRAIIQEVLAGADMVFITAGMGGGTGTGAAPIIAQVARELGALTVGVVTKPFVFEGKRRKGFSENGIMSLRQAVDTLITIPNQRLLSIAEPTMSMLDGFKLADDVLLNAVKGISDIINIPGRVNVDFADVRTIMSEMGMALMGIGAASGASRAAEAARAAINSPLLEDIDIEGATGILINITGSSSMSLHEISEASSLIQEAAHEDANIIFGAVIDDHMGEVLRVTVIATGFDHAHVSFPDGKGTHLGFGASHQVQPGGAFAQQGMAQASHPHQGQSSHSHNQARPGYGQNSSYDNRTSGSVHNPGNGRPHQGGQYAGQPPRHPQDMAPQSPRQNYGQVNQEQDVRRPSPQQGSQFSRGRDANEAPPPRHPSEFEELAQWTMEMSRNQDSQNRAGQPRNASKQENQERNISGASGQFENAQNNSTTEDALNLARELSDVNFGGEDFETPAFLRRKDDQPKS